MTYVRLIAKPTDLPQSLIRFSGRLGVLLEDPEPGDVHAAVQFGSKIFVVGIGHLKEEPPTPLAEMMAGARTVPVDDGSLRGKVEIERS